MLRLLAILALSLQARGELPFPLPKIQRLVPPALTEPAEIAIEGTALVGPFEVFIGDALANAHRVSPTRLMIEKESIAPLFREVGRTRERTYPIWIRVAGEKSNRAQLAIVNAAHGNLHGSVSVAKNRLVPGAGVKVKIRERGLEARVAPDGTFVFRDLPPGEAPLTLEWPGVAKEIQATAMVRPGDTASAPAFKIDLPAPSVSAVVPNTIKDPEPLLIKGAGFLAEADAPFEVLIDGRAVRALRAREDAIQIPSAGLLPYLAQVPKKTGRKTAKLVVKVAGMTTAPVELTFVRLRSDRRDVSAE